uniref:Uncharacterized protein n=1 Tax=viral metagenome TaxID=1070528 RepID=A0A6C0LZB2_9ZZZZ
MKFLKNKFPNYQINWGGGNSISEAGISEAVRAGISEAGISEAGISEAVRAGISEAGISITNPVVALVAIAVERHDCTDH